MAIFKYKRLLICLIVILVVGVIVYNSISGIKKKEILDREKINMNKNTTICAFGDSITASGEWVGEVFDNVKEQGVKVYNCGVAGDTAYDSQRRMEEDCLCYNPTNVIVMFGVNDMNHWYAEKDVSLSFVESLIDEYELNLEKVIKKFQDRNIDVILCSPPPYLEGSYYLTADNQCNNRLKKCAEISKSLAKKYKCHFIDMYNVFSSKEKMQQYYKEDRVHPNARGQRLIAETILQYLGIDYKSQYNKKFEYSELNRKRMELETIYRKVMYAKHDTIGKHCDRLGITMSKEEEIEFLKEEMTKAEFTAHCANIYFKYNDDLPKIKSEIIELTEKMASTGK
ncbi:SGNH/GDSL hydrolase family protein [Eubacterium sp.]